MAEPVEITFNQFPVLIVRRNSAAWQAITRICRDEVKPGSCLPVSDDEFDSLMNDVIQLKVEPEEDAHGR